MTLLQQIINDAVEGDCDIAALLRRCRILAQRLALPEFKEWVIYELEGYPSVEVIPEYRVVVTPLILGTFFGSFGRSIKNAQIPVLSIPEQFRELLTTLKLLQGVASIEALIADQDQGLKIPIPADWIPYIGQGDIYEDFHLAQAHRIVNPHLITGVLDQVQNRVLSFALELESRNPEAGEAIMKSQKIPDDQVRNIFKTVIKGDVQNLAQASEDFSQNALNKIIPGDFASLRKSLSGLGLTEVDVDELEIAIRSDKDAGGQGFGDGVTRWLGKLALKVSEGAVTIASTAGTTAVTELIKRYLVS